MVKRSVLDFLWRQTNLVFVLRILCGGLHFIMPAFALNKTYFISC